MLNVIEEPYMLRKENGLLVKAGGTPAEYTAFAKGLKAGQSGWIEIRYASDYVANTHFNVRRDGEPHFTNAHFSAGDCEAIVKAIGREAAQIFLGNSYKL